MKKQSFRTAFSLKCFQEVPEPPELFFYGKVPALDTVVEIHRVVNALVKGLVRLLILFQAELLERHTVTHQLCGVSYGKT